MNEHGTFGSVYRRFGARPIVNAAGTKTRLGGVPMAAEVVEAIRLAAGASVDMAELQAAASRHIADVTGAEAGLVTAGASAGLMLGAAACLAGDDPAAIDRLPEVVGDRNEIVIFRAHRNSYDHAWRTAGARLVEVGLDDRTAGSGVRSLDRWELEAAVSERTVALAYVASAMPRPPLDIYVEVAARHGIPVLVDAAAMLPPVANLRAYVDAGADLIAFSGGKAIGGPQSSGFLCGRRSLVTAAALNSLDLDVDTERWRLPSAFGHDHERRGLPRHGIGRVAKVSKEHVIGALVALDRFASGRWQAEQAWRHELAGRLAAEADAAGHAARPTHHEIPRVRISFPNAAAAWGFATALADGDPSIAVDTGAAPEGAIVVDTIGLDEHTGPLVIAAVMRALRRPER